jgi:adenylate kinase
MILVLLGAPGVGKGTQAAALAARFKVPHISTGDIFRRNLADGTPLGLKAKGFMERGELVPDALVLDLVHDRLKEPDARGGFLMDGFPRTRVQAEEFDRQLRSIGLKIDHVVLLEVNADVLVKRLSGRRVCRQCGMSFHVEFNPPPKDNVCPACGGEIYQRKDDSEEAIKNRLKVYDELTSPLIEYYGGQGLIRRVDGDGAPKQVENRIAQAVTVLP